MSYAVARIIYGIDLTELLVEHAENTRYIFTDKEIEAFDNASEVYEDDYIISPYAAGGYGTSALGVVIGGFDECENSKVKDLTLVPTEEQIKEFQEMVETVKTEYPELAKVLEDEPEVFFLWGSS